MTHPQALYRPEQVRELDRRALKDVGVPGYELMCRAGAAAWALLQSHWPQVRRIGVACGPGNNGGDGYVLARLAKAAGLDVVVLVAPGADPRTPDARHAARDWRGAGGTVATFDGRLPKVELWVDAIYGLGLMRPPGDAVQSIIERINASHKPVLPLDLPSGRGAGPGTRNRLEDLRAALRYGLPARRRPHAPDRPAPRRSPSPIRAPGPLLGDP